MSAGIGGAVVTRDDHRGIRGELAEQRFEVPIELGWICAGVSLREDAVGVRQVIGRHEVEHEKMGRGSWRRAVRAAANTSAL